MDNNIAEYINKVGPIICISAREMTMTIYRDWPRYRVNNYESFGNEKLETLTKNELLRDLSDKESEMYLEAILFLFHFASCLPQRMLDRKLLYYALVVKMPSLSSEKVDYDSESFKSYTELAAIRRLEYDKLVRIDESGKAAVSEASKKMAHSLDPENQNRARAFISLDIIGPIINIEDVYKKIFD